MGYTKAVQENTHIQVIIFSLMENAILDLKKN